VRNASLFIASVVLGAALSGCDHPTTPPWHATVEPRAEAPRHDENPRWPFPGERAKACFADVRASAAADIRTTVDAFVDGAPESGTFSVAAYVLEAQDCHCADHRCGRCHPFIRLSDTYALNSAFATAPSPSVVVFTDEAPRFEPSWRYEMTFRVCDADEHVPRLATLVSARRLSP
jgi:hypothetical protein